MSLNGLDHPTVSTAHTAALGHPSGWFLLSYAARDEVVLHAEGSDGYAEMRGVIECYGEPSILYGFLMFFGQRVLVKYQPEECSRLLQARAMVHFNMLCDKFQYDHLYDIITPLQLRQNKLAGFCDLDPDDLPPPNSPQNRPAPAVQVPELPALEEPTESSVEPASVPAPPSVISMTESTLPEITTTPTNDYPIPFPPDDYTPSYKPKVLLTARPAEQNRPSSSASATARSISSLPAGFKAKKEKEKKKDTDEVSISERPKSAGLSVVESMVPPPPSPTVSVASAKEKISPEKMRLMKAMKLREKKKSEERKKVEAAKGDEEEEDEEDDEDEDDHDEDEKEVVSTIASSVEGELEVIVVKPTEEETTIVEEATIIEGTPVVAVDIPEVPVRTELSPVVEVDTPLETTMGGIGGG